MSSKNDFGTILVAVDGSKHSEKCVSFACDLAKRVSGKIMLAFISPYKELEKEYDEYTGVETVVSEETSQRITRRENPMGIDEYYKVIGNAVLSTLESKIKAEGLTCETLFEVGNPAAKIVELAQENQAEMIIVGLQGLHGLGRLRSLGSVSRRIIENATCPVLVVP